MSEPWKEVLICVSGCTGSGKTTLAHSIKHMLGEYDIEAEVFDDEKDTLLELSSGLRGLGKAGLKVKILTERVSDITSAVYEELANIVKNEPVFPGDTISHKTARQCVELGWASRNAQGDFVATDKGKWAHEVMQDVEVSAN